ncbi:recombinase family protein [Leisingera sp.]|uniref:recombinase family protein n=1 Tax=Leisingera sp. TaxID=1879318 RepID=UPI002B27332A|nr:recombinase family protein [Leisingera sp.]
MPETSVRAAEYVRVSTDHPRYSTEIQAEAIRAYAARRNMEVVRTFADQGKSGLRIEGHDALQSLVELVNSGTADFDAILVYDVSRWSLFKDADEGAYLSTCAAALTLRSTIAQTNSTMTEVRLPTSSKASSALWRETIAKSQRRKSLQANAG